MGDAKKQSYLPQPQKPPAPLQSLATASFAPCIQLLPPPGIPAALAHALMGPERLQGEVMGATTAQLYHLGTAQPYWGEGLVEPRAGQKEQVHACRCPSLHRCCFAALRCGQGKQRMGPGVIVCSSPAPLWVNHFYLCFLLKEGGEGEDPEIPHPTTKKATASPSAEPRR